MSDETQTPIVEIPTKEALRESLRENVLEVSFLKLDGTRRVMNCTLKEGVIPEVKSANTEKPAKSIEDNPNVTVWDCDINGWRSFRYDRVQEVKTVES